MTEVTDEMIEAGIAEIGDFDLKTAEAGVAEDLVKRIFEAMLLFQPKLSVDEILDNQTAKPEPDIFSRGRRDDDDA